MIMTRLTLLPQDLASIYEELLLSLSKALNGEKNRDERKMTTRFFQWVVFSNRALQLREWYTIAGLIRDVPLKSMKQWTESQDFPRNELERIPHSLRKGIREPNSSTLERVKGRNTGDTLEKWIKRTSRGLVEVSQTAELEVVDVESTKSAVAGSAALDIGETRRVYPIHETLRQYFLDAGFAVLDSKLSPPENAKIEGHKTIIQNCFQYLQIEELDVWANCRMDQHPASIGSGFKSGSKLYESGEELLKLSNESSNHGLYKRGEEPWFLSAESSGRLSDRSSNHRLPMKPLKREPGTIEGLAYIRETSEISSINSCDRVGNWLEDNDTALNTWPFCRESISEYERQLPVPSQVSSISSYQIMEPDPYTQVKPRFYSTCSNKMPKSSLGIVAASCSDTVAASCSNDALLGDIFALLQYATDEVFVHVGIEEFQSPSRDMNWLVSTLLDGWDRLVLLCNDIRRDVSLLHYCVKADLNTLLVPVLLHSKF
jgi:hypothetical protein